MSFFYKPIGPKFLKAECDIPVLIPYLKSHREEIIQKVGGQFQEPDADEPRTWTLLENWQGEIFTDSGIIRARAFKGASLDFASIPGLLESIEKRDDRTGLMAAFFHDTFFAVQYPFFDVSNSLFYEVNRFYGMGSFQAWRRWKAVQSAAGWAAWKKSSEPGKVFEERKFFSVTEWAK